MLDRISHVSFIGYVSRGWKVRFLVLACVYTRGCRDVGTVIHIPHPAIQFSQLRAIRHYTSPTPPTTEKEEKV